MSDKTAKPILLTAMDIRHSVHQLIKSEILELAVLSYQELADDISVQTMAQINLSK
jgi:type III secretion protein V